MLTEMASVRSWREARAVETRWYSDSVSSNTVCHCCKGKFTVEHRVALIHATFHSTFRECLYQMSSTLQTIRRQTTLPPLPSWATIAA